MAPVNSGPVVRTSARPSTITQQRRLQSSSHTSTTSETYGLAAMFRKRRRLRVDLGLASTAEYTRAPSKA